MLNIMMGQEKQQISRCARQTSILTSESEPLIRPSIQPLWQFKLSTICARLQSFKQISLGQAAETFNIPTLPSLPRQHLHDIWGRDVVSVIWGYRNEVKEDITLQPHNKVAFYTPEFHNPQQMNWVLLDCSVEGTPDGETHRWAPQVIWVRVGDIMDDGLCGCRPTFLVLYFTYLPLPGPRC
jgi:hypothetical protein